MAAPKKVPSKRVPQAHGGTLTPFQPGQSGNPSGPKPGYKHLSTHIQELLNDPEFETWLLHPTKGYELFKGAPMKAIIEVAIKRALYGDDKAMQWLAVHGYGHNVNLTTGDPVAALLEEYKIIEIENDGQTTSAMGRPSPSQA